MRDITFCVSTFLRDESLYRCIKSIRSMYPKSQIIVTDDGRHSVRKSKRLAALNMNYYKLPFDTGLSYKRNFMVHRVKTPYVAMVDDDMEITSEANIPKLLKLLDIADLACGCVRYNSRREEAYLARLHFKKQKLLMRPIRSPQETYEGIPYQRTHLVMNCFVAKVDKLRQIGWDERYKTTYEHLDFFVRCRLADVYVVYHPGSIFLEYRDRNPEYLKFRGRHEIAKEIFFKKWGIDGIVKDRSLMNKNELKAQKKI